MTHAINNFNPVLLSKSELQWLLEDIDVSKSFEYKIKSSIKKKIQILTKLELPLLVKNNFFATDSVGYVGNVGYRKCVWYLITSLTRI